MADNPPRRFMYRVHRMQGVYGIEVESYLNSLSSDGCRIVNVDYHPVGEAFITVEYELAIVQPPRADTSRMGYRNNLNELR